ncbi:unnamed protein product, partial [Diplocarpon coronariae]
SDEESDLIHKIFL